MEIYIIISDLPKLSYHAGGGIWLGEGVQGSNVFLLTS